LSRRCPACGSARTRPNFKVRTHRFRRCRNCGSLFLESVPPAAELAELYGGPRYFRNPEFGAGSYHGYLDYEADREHIVGKFDAILARIETQIDPGRLLDVGCGPGAMLSAATARGWQAEGIDLNPWAVEEAADRHGLDARLGSLPDPRLPSERFDVVTMMDLIEHVPDPSELLAEVARILEAGGMIAILTPDAGSWTSRGLGSRWPEALRAPEHVTLFSVPGLERLVDRSGFAALGYHSVGKTSTLATLAADISPVAPAVLDPIADRLASSRFGQATFELDPRTKVCLYARLGHAGSPAKRVPRLPRRPPPQPPHENVLDDLRALGKATGLREWLFARLCGSSVLGAVAEVGAGIGTFTELLLTRGAETVTALEPDPLCRRELARRLGGDPRLSVVADEVPGSKALRSDEFDLIVCQNVLEHIDDHAGAVAEMSRALRPGGRLALLVPAGPRLYGSLDLAYGHRRRYRGAEVRELLERSGLQVDEIAHVNALGIPGWWLSNRLGRSRIGGGSIALYESLLRLWRPVEDRLGLGFGLSLIARASAGFGTAGDPPARSFDSSQGTRTDEVR
jgi:2-polyprenyl-3-methyl-5-hydroxy-6-metoxy-1,4-benzoquinol methylase